jgi:phosphoenolpyruvate carboxylase
MVRFRRSRGAARSAALADARRRLSALAPGRRPAFARAFTLYLELVNACESAWRTHRLRAAGPRPAPGKARLTWVLTAHPTESRSPGNIALLRRIQRELLAALDEDREPDGGRLKELLRVVWRAGTFPPHAPRVEDEARHVYSLLTDDVLDEFLTLRARGHALSLRCWVGGDKDGNPRVGPGELLASLALSRERLAGYLRARLLEPARELAALSGRRAPVAALDSLTALLEKGLAPRGDGGRMRAARRLLERAVRAWRREFGRAPPALERGLELLRMFPGLVVPLELRERAGLFMRASPVARMLAAAREAARGGELRWYAGGCVVSMTESAEDIRQARRLARAELGRTPFPVVPLFELPETLPRAAAIMEEVWGDPGARRTARARGGVEMMLGYSDTGKRFGPLPTRLAVFEAMRDVSAWARRRRLRVLFFHGAGGSAGRGGGTIEEQASCWPASSLRELKLTLQGEMVERTLASPEILRSQVLHAARVQAAAPRAREPSAPCARLSLGAAEAFRSFARDPGLAPLLREATPYARLGAVRLGSRPALRPGRGGGELEALRAIPWVLCWTQTRMPLPSWYGAGSAWLALRGRPRARAELRRAVASDALLRAFIRQLDFSLEKSEPLIWREYLRGLRSAPARLLARRVEEDRRGALLLCREAAPGRPPLWDRPWLRESIFYRAPMIHPLNLLQLLVLRRPRWSPAEERLFRETVTGIASGMLTTG